MNILRQWLLSFLGCALILLSASVLASEKAMLELLPASPDMDNIRENSPELQHYQSVLLENGESFFVLKRQYLPADAVITEKSFEQIHIDEKGEFYRVTYPSDTPLQDRKVGVLLDLKEQFIEHYRNLYRFVESSKVADGFVIVINGRAIFFVYFDTPPTGGKKSVLGVAKKYIPHFKSLVDQLALKNR